MADQNEFTPKRAVKSQVKLKLAIEGPSGSGKTEGALALVTNFLLSSGMKREDMKILLIDTENESASLYADRYIFDTIPLSGPYTPERYKMAMWQAIKGGYHALIVDGISHEWSGDGGILRQKDKLDAVPNSNSYTNWATLTPKHEAFIECIKQIPIHTICTMRSKQAYVLEANNKGKLTPRKVGMQAVQRDDSDYEFTIVFKVNSEHAAYPSKDRTDMFPENEPVDLKNPDTATAIREWLTDGKELSTSVDTSWAPPEPVEKPKPAVVEQISQRRQAPPSQAQRAAKPNLITTNAKGKFWLDARKSGKSDEDVRRYLVERFSIDSSSKIPAEFTEEAIAWASKPLPTRHVAPGEEKCRELARTLQISESDLIYEVAVCRNDWNATYERLSRAEDARLAAIEAADEAAAMATA